MDSYEMSLQVMDDDGAGSAITSIPAGQSYETALKAISARYRAEWAQAQTLPTFGEARDAAYAADRKRVVAYQQALADETSRIAREHEAAFAALPGDEQASQYARFEQGTAGAWLGTCSS